MSQLIKILRKKNSNVTQHVLSMHVVPLKMLKIHTCWDLIRLNYEQC